MDAIPPLASGDPEGLTTGAPQNALLDFFFPGFSVYSTAVSKYLHIDLNLYIPLVLIFGGLTFVWRYFSEYFSNLAESHLMSVVDIRPDDEIYNMLMAWVANQSFSKKSRRFVVNTNLNSRSWYLWRSFEDDEEEDGEGGDDSTATGRNMKKKALAYTPTFGSHWFLYKNRILVFQRKQNAQQSPFMTATEREEISISCFGRNPWVLKELLHEAREEHMKRDEAKTLIYRGTTKSGSSEPMWQRSLARASRPFSTVILNEKVKKDLIDDVTDYLNPATRRWYSNRGIPYRRGYLLHGPPGTGKSSLSLALAGFFKMRIYIVSLSSVTANEENLASLFAELPRRCVVLLEDIDSAGLTHTRENGNHDDNNNGNNNDNNDSTTDTTTSSRKSRPGQAPNPNPNSTGRLSLSGLLNILDGVASQEGRLLVMTTNHIDKLDKALIRPGRVDMIVKFDRADTEMTAAIFRAIYAPLEGDDVPSPSPPSASSSKALFQLESTTTSSSVNSAAAAARLTPEEEKQQAADTAEAARKKAETIARVDVLAAQFAAKIPAHEFSPAEIQGYLLKNKRDPARTVEGAEQWVIDTRKEKKEKELKEAEEKREKEEKEKKEKEEEEKKKKEEEEKEEKEKKKKEKRKGRKEKKEEKKKAAKKSKKKASKKDESDSGSSGSESESEADSGSESEREPSKKKSKSVSAAVCPAEEKPAVPAVSEVKAESLPVSVPTITVDTDKANEAAVEMQKTPGGDSGYGTP